MAIPEHHKTIAAFIRKLVGDPFEVHEYGDNRGKRKMAIASCGPGKSRFYSTIGLSDEKFNIQPGSYEFAAFGHLHWIPNVITTSVYWLRERQSDRWPLVCEDVVRQNVKSTYRHMAFLPAPFALELENGREISWLLGVPITDKQILITEDEVGDALLIQIKKHLRTDPE